MKRFSIHICPQLSCCSKKKTPPLRSKCQHRAARVSSKNCPIYLKNAQIVSENLGVKSICYSFCHVFLIHKVETCFLYEMKTIYNLQHKKNTYNACVLMWKGETSHDKASISKQAKRLKENLDLSGGYRVVYWQVIWGGFRPPKGPGGGHPHLIPIYRSLAMTGYATPRWCNQ